jgi:hypothetical protein
MSLDDGICPICGELLEAYYSAFQRSPFIDGKKYDGICQVCAEFPVWGQYNEKGELVLYDPSDPHLSTVEKMMNGSGFDQKRVEICLKAIKSLIKKRLHVNPIMVKWTPWIPPDEDKDDEVPPPKKYKPEFPKKKYKKA